jgi:hypothetical protein
MKSLLQNLMRKFGYKMVRYESLAYDRRILEIYELFEVVTNIIEKNLIKGVFVECGFGYGRSFAVLSHFATKYKRKIYGFDSFSGFPNVLEIDQSIRNPKKGEWSVRSEKEAIKSMVNLGIFADNQGFALEKVIFNEKIKNPIPSQEIALLHIDLDLYEGYKYALVTFWDQVEIGGIVIFDEYKLTNWPGATAAINEFLVAKNLNSSEIKELKGKHYIVKR